MNVAVRNGAASGELAGRTTRIAAKLKKCMRHQCGETSRTLRSSWVSAIMYHGRVFEQFYFARPVGLNHSAAVEFIKWAEPESKGGPVGKLVSLNPIPR
ncbi:MAG TPA: hypothetical protein VJ783_08550 [Pirellulales bacterium]|nr:hypothetical protein [Pirellulales bacterium]